MNREIERLERERREHDREVCRLEREIGDLQRACKHVRMHDDLNWCEECGGRVPVDYEDPAMPLPR